MTFREILKQFREETLTERDKGARFEKLMQRWLRTDPRYADIFQDVWMWEDFPARQELGGADTGIDLVARTADSEYWAIQCKCYADDSVIDKPAVDSFLSTSSRKFHCDGGVREFSNRLWISTTDHWGRNALETLNNQTIPVNRIGASDLENSPVDWDVLVNGKQGRSARLAGKQPRPHQLEAMAAAHAHFKDHERGQLIMACGTGKTYTALQIMEKETHGKGLVLFMVPSIALLGQTLNAWNADAKKPIRSVLICSDAKANHRTGEADDDDLPINDLALPASTSVPTIVKQLERYREYDGLVVVFSTYQSIDVIATAQKELLQQDPDFGTFDFIVCDEAHRTTGACTKGAKQSDFTKIHDASLIKAAHRMYMTATPRMYSESAKSSAKVDDATLWSMDNEEIYGHEFFRVGFGRAVSEGLLTDYKVLILTVTENDIPDSLKSSIESKDSREIDYDIGAKLAGCVKALSKAIIGDDGLTREADPLLMRRALAFCSRIGSEDIPGTSKNVAQLFPRVSKKLYDDLEAKDNAGNFSDLLVKIEAKHIDGSMDSEVRGSMIDWLKEDSPNGECRVLSNVRCLSEGVDVPALDAVLFLDPRNSEVDVVQSVGRVMRSFQGKKYGYIIIPVVIPPNMSATEAMNDNKRFSVVWKILNALRAHDEQFNAEVNAIHLNRKKGQGKIAVVRPGDPFPMDPAPAVSPAEEKQAIQDELDRQLDLNFEDLKESIYAKLVEKVGDRLYWENWSKRVGVVAQNFIARISAMIEKPGAHRKAFEEFVDGLRKNINPTITDGSAIEMLAQHLITQPVFDALFKDYSFVSNNSVSRAMQSMIDLLQNQAIEKDTAELQNFYKSVQENVAKIDNLEGRQTIIRTLYEKFFKGAFPKTVEQLGIIYTPVECVDFILHSVDHLLKQEFGRSLTDEGIHILDPFTGTGTFPARLLQSGLIRPEDLRRKYLKEIHCNEIVLLAYYVADVNIESIYHDLVHPKEYEPFDGICLTDTFELNEGGSRDIFSELLKENSEALEKQRQAPIRVIIGNPPYAVAQKDISYEALEQRIAETYAAGTDATNKNSLYDSYIEAFRWASDRIDKEHGGIVAFISNGSWMNGNAMGGMRKCFEKEFSSIYVLDCRGNCRCSGELRRREGDGIFGLGSRTPIAITFLVKNPKAVGKAKIYYHDIGDYLKREDKLGKLRDAKSIASKTLEWKMIAPDEHGDWLNQRNDKFAGLIPLAPEKKFDARSESVFCVYSRGLESDRDAWVYGFSGEALRNRMNRMVKFYNSQVKGFIAEREKNRTLSAEAYKNSDSTKISWSSSLVSNLERGNFAEFENAAVVKSQYRPFVRMNLYAGDKMIQRRGQSDLFFPNEEAENLVICVSGVGVTKNFSALITDAIPDLELIGKSQCFPLYWYEKAEGNQENFFNGGSGYIRRDGITDWMLKTVRARYGGTRAITKKHIFYYVYGLLHAEDYRQTFAADLKKELPRIPIAESVDDFMAFYKAGKELAELHLNYDKFASSAVGEVEFSMAAEGFSKWADHPEVLLDGVVTPPDGIPEEALTVQKMRFPAKGQKDTILLNSRLTVRNIPAAAYEYVVNGKSAIEWIMERYAVTMDKDSGIVNDPNDWAREHNCPDYILRLLLSVIRLSVRSAAIVKTLPQAVEGLS